MMKTWWLSFADPDKPKGLQFLGVIVVKAVSFQDAHATSLLCGNPGGEVQGVELPDEIAAKVPDRYLHHLLSRQETMELDEIL